MLDTYIKSTAGVARWLLFTALMFFGPVFKAICLFFAVGGLFAFMFMLVMQSNHPFAQTAMYIMLGGGLIGTALLVYYNMNIQRMFDDRMYPEESDEDEIVVAWWKKTLNWLFVLTVFAGFCVAATWFYSFKPYRIEGLAVGFVWWLAAGVVLGVCRWFYRHARGVPGAVVELLRDARWVVSGWMKKKAPARKVKAAEPLDNVVQLRRRG